MTEVTTICGYPVAGEVKPEKNMHLDFDGEKWIPSYPVCNPLLESLHTDHLEDGAVTASKLASESVNHHHLAAHLQAKLAKIAELEKRLAEAEQKVGLLTANQGASTFSGLMDTPDITEGSANHVLATNATGDGMIWVSMDLLRGPSGTAIARLLEALVGEDRLSASAVKHLPMHGTPSMQGQEIVSALDTLTGTSRLGVRALRDIEDYVDGRIRAYFETKEGDDQ